MITGYHVSRAIHVVAKLGIADHLSEGPRHVDDLAKATGTHARSLKRVLRLLASVGLFTEETDGRFALTPVGACLRAGAPGSMRPAAYCSAAKALKVNSRHDCNSPPSLTFVTGCQGTRP
nr:methyltransferase dimerization domain-containing protein [Mesorhizobium prunaredense]